MITAQDILDNDPRLQVRINWDSTSRNIERGIWHGQHECVSETPGLDDTPPANPGQAIIKHQLTPEHSAHYSVLNWGYLALHCYGFPHSTMTQITRHRDSSHLVQSGRYTGQRFVDVADGEIDVADVFYFRPIGTYQSRQAKRYEYEVRELKRDRLYCHTGCEVYDGKIRHGFSEEHARENSIPYNFRQNFAIAGTIEAVFHWVDQRSKKDSQLEIQALALLGLQCLKEAAPNLGQWYEDNRYGRARLAP
jgi:thymidylate synthase (FAD)